MFTNIDQEEMNIIPTATSMTNVYVLLKVHTHVQGGIWLQYSEKEVKLLSANNGNYIHNWQTAW